MENKLLIYKLHRDKSLSKEEFTFLIENSNEETLSYLQSISLKTKEEVYGKDIYVRGLIEISNYCKNNCFYCGIRKDNKDICRYRLTKEEILQRCEIGYKLGFSTFVMQGGEDDGSNDNELIDIINSIRKKYPDCAITLSIGEREKAIYQSFFDAGANRYLLRHETADNKHYSKLHPKSMSLDFRKECLFNLKEIGFQTGTGLMVGSPYQTSENLAEDMVFIKKLDPQMVGIGPFLPHVDTPFKDKKPGTLNQTLLMVGMVRLMLPNALIPATTAIETLSQNGRKKAILMGANVIMPNLSPVNNQNLYTLYNRPKQHLEVHENLEKFKEQMLSIGQQIVMDRGDYKGGNTNVIK